MKEKLVVLLMVSKDRVHAYLVSEIYAILAID